MVFVGCELPSCPKSSNMWFHCIVYSTCLKETLGMLRILCIFLNFFVSEEHSDYRCILEMIYISMFMENLDV